MARRIDFLEKTLQAAIASAVGAGDYCVMILGSARSGAAAIALFALFRLIGEDATTTHPSPLTPPPVSGETAHARLQGRAVDLLHHLAATHPIDKPSAPASVLAFHTHEGRLYTLLHTRASTALFTDPRLLKKELILFGRLFPGSMVFEPTNYRSVINGRQHELFYWCDICSIKSLSPELCACCQEPVVLTEKPITD